MLLLSLLSHNISEIYHIPMPINLNISHISLYQHYQQFLMQWASHEARTGRQPLIRIKPHKYECSILYNDIVHAHDVV